MPINALNACILNNLFNMRKIITDIIYKLTETELKI